MSPLFLPGAAALAGAALLAGLFLEPEQFFRSWWLAWLFYAGLALGGIPLVSLHFLTGGRWGVVARRAAEAAMATLPLIIVAFGPAAGGLAHIFPWAHPGALPAGSHQARWLTPQGWLLRSGLYLGVLLIAGFFLRLYTRAESQRDNALNAGIRSGLGGVSAVAYVLTMNFAATDWAMSLEPPWYSSIYAVIFMASQFLSTLALAVAVTLWAPDGPEEAAVPKTRRDLGNLLLAFVIFWTYVSFSQFLIIWSGNLPREIAWYAHRRGGGWPWVALGLAAAQFVLPFVLLLSRRRKEQGPALPYLAAWVVGLSAVHWYWLVVPAWHPEGVHGHWLDAAAFLFLGVLFALFYRRQWRRLPALTTGGHR